MDTNRFKEEIQQGEDMFQNGEIREALNMFESVLENDPDNIAALNDKGVALNKLGRFQEAIQTFSEVVSKDNRNANAVFNLISNYFAVGNWKGAEDIFVQYAHCLSPHNAEMIKKDLEKIRSYKNNIPASPDKLIIEAFDYTQFQSRVNDVLHRTIFFIVGPPKSGSTWLQHLLDGHPEICCMGESHLSDKLAPFLEEALNRYNKEIVQANLNINRRHGYPQFAKENLEYLVVTSIGLLLGNLVNLSMVKCIGEKTPDHIRAMPLLARLFPSAKFIHIIRDGRDVTVSGWFHNLRVNPSSFKRRFTDFRSYVELCARDWVSEIQQARSFGKTYPDRYIELHYEKLHTDPDPIIRQMLNFLDVDSSTQMVERCREAGSFKKLSQGRERGQEDESSFFRKGTVGDWKNHFDQSSLDAFMQYGGALLRELGYK